MTVSIQIQHAASGNVSVSWYSCEADVFRHVCRACHHATEDSVRFYPGPPGIAIYGLACEPGLWFMTLSPRHQTNCKPLHRHNLHGREKVDLQELEALMGWKYTVSFMLEAADMVLPIFRSCMARVSAAISWLLVKLIGRALGLIYRGVKQSLVPRQPRQRRQSKNEADADEMQTWVPKFS